MVNVRFLVTDFASHRIWAEGYQHYSWKQDSRQCHDVRLDIIPADRWKFRMMAAAAELESYIALDDDIVVVDAMIDVTVLVAILKSNRPPHQCPIVLVYCHENQLTTPFSPQDRDVKNHTHWHYGVAHYRSLLVADGFIFNSETQFQAFRCALPKLLNEQAPRDTVTWHLERCQMLINNKCTVLQYGLDLEGLMCLEGCNIDARRQEVPIILWNARLDEDKDPGTFIELLQQVQRKASFKLIILGEDLTYGQKWYARLEQEFGTRILYMGWCCDRSEYAKWLMKSSIVVSTAIHETFGISIVESVWCGVLPLLPNRLSYPELFWELGGPNGPFVYKSIHDASDKLLYLLHIAANNPLAFSEAQSRTRATAARFRWQVMGPVYDQFFSQVAKGLPIGDAGSEALSVAIELNGKSVANTTNNLSGQKPGFVELSVHTVNITTEEDSRVQLFRPKTLRNHQDYHLQLSRLREKGIEVSLHGGRRAMVRMLEAIRTGAKINPVCFLMTKEVKKAVFRDDNRLSQFSQTGNDTALQNGSIPLYLADKEMLNKIRGQKVNAGDAILAIVQFPIISELDDLIARPPILILENVRNAENVGSILRTAFCLGITSVIASDTAWSAIKDSRGARCSMGTMYFHRYYKIDSCHDKNNSNCLVESIHTIRGAGICVYGIEIGENCKEVAPHRANREWAVVLGNEDCGLSSAVVAACDQILFIPQVHGDSLNVGHAAAIALYELGRDGPVRQHDGLASCS